MSDTSVGTVSIDLKLDSGAFDRALATTEAKAAGAGNRLDRMTPIKQTDATAMPA